MGFACQNELEIGGASDEERRRASQLVPSLEAVDESSVANAERGELTVLRFSSEDDVPEEGVAAIAAQFPELSFLLVYYSRDGGFYGYLRIGPGGMDSGSEDIEDQSFGPSRDGGYEMPELIERFGGDGIAFARERFGLGTKKT
jgi:hypothetical protein